MDCWIGAFDAGKPKVSKDLECRSETWDPSAWGRVYKYHGDRQRTAVYVLTKPARFVGCYRESAAPRFSKAFSQSVRGVSMEGCAAIALGAGSDRCAMRLYIAPDDFETCHERRCCASCRSGTDCCYSPAYEISQAALLRAQEPRGFAWIQHGLLVRRL